MAGIGVAGLKGSHETPRRNVSLSEKPAQLSRNDARPLDNGRHWAIATPLLTCKKTVKTAGNCEAAGAGREFAAIAAHELPTSARVRLSKARWQAARPPSSVPFGLRSNLVALWQPPSRASGWTA